MADSTTRKTAQKKSSPTKKTTSKQAKTASKSPSKTADESASKSVDKTASKSASTSDGTTKKAASARAEAPSRARRSESSERDPGRDPGQGTRVAATARDAVLHLTGKRPEGVTGLARTDDGWAVEVEVLELERIPNTTDVLAIYEVTMSGDGELQGCQRIRRYLRGSPGD